MCFIILKFTWTSLNKPSLGRQGHKETKHVCQHKYIS